MERSWSDKQPKPSPEAGTPEGEREPRPGAPVAGGEPRAGERQVVMAARAMSVASFALVAGVGLYGAKTVTRLFRR